MPRLDEFVPHQHQSRCVCCFYYVFYYVFFFNIQHVYVRVRTQPNRKYDFYILISERDKKTVVIILKLCLICLKSQAELAKDDLTRSNLTNMSLATTVLAGICFLQSDFLKYATTTILAKSMV